MTGCGTGSTRYAGHVSVAGRGPTVDARDADGDRRRIPRPRAAVFRLPRPDGDAEQAARRTAPPGLHRRAAGTCSPGTATAGLADLPRRPHPARLPERPPVHPSRAPGGTPPPTSCAEPSSPVWTYPARVRLHAPVETIAEQLTPRRPVDPGRAELHPGDRSRSLRDLAGYLGTLDVAFDVIDPLNSGPCCASSPTATPTLPGRPGTGCAIVCGIPHHGVAPGSGSSLAGSSAAPVRPRRAFDDVLAADRPIRPVRALEGEGPADGEGR